MKMLLPSFVENSRVLLELKFALLRPAHWLFYKLRNSPGERRVAETGHLDVIACPDFALIPKHPQAGTVQAGRLVMHNGVRVLPTGYLGYPVYSILRKTKGVHEPQEEWIFGQIIRTLPPGSCMVELGAYWAFYSLWFRQAITDGRSILVEPVLSHLNYGRKNFSINKRRGDFVQALVGARAERSGAIPTISVDSLVEEKRIDHLHLLHADIQGHEVEMLEGAQATIARRAIDWMFISTHSNDLHRRCREFVLAHGFRIVADLDLDDVWGVDGVLVAQRADLPEMEIHTPSRRRR